MKSFELENKIENLKAHYSVIKGKVNQITQEINDAIEAKQQALFHKSQIEDEIDTKQSQLLGISRALNNTQNELKEAIQELEDKREEMDEIELEYEESLNALLEAVDNREKRIRQLDTEFEDKVTNYGIRIFAKKIELSTLENNLNGIEEKIVETEEEHKKIRASFALEEQEMTTIRYHLEQERDELEYQREDIGQREQEQYKRYIELNERLKDLKTREADAQVYFNRLQRAYQQIKPGTVIKI